MDAATPDKVAGAVGKPLCNDPRKQHEKHYLQHWTVDLPRLGVQRAVRLPKPVLKCAGDRMAKQRRRFSLRCYPPLRVAALPLRRKVVAQVVASRNPAPGEVRTLCKQPK